MTNNCYDQVSFILQTIENAYEDLAELIGHPALYPSSRHGSETYRSYGPHVLGARGCLRTAVGLLDAVKSGLEPELPAITMVPSLQPSGDPLAE